MRNSVKFALISLWVMVSAFSFLSFAAPAMSDPSSLTAQKSIVNIPFTGNILFTWLNPAWIWFAAYQLTFLPNGNIGVGVQNPAYKLQVAGNVGATSYMFTWVTTWSVGFTTSQLIFLKNGNIGVGITSPMYTLAVSWSAIAGNFYLWSDKNLKTNIVPLDGALQKITQLNGYSFAWKDSGKKDIGLIAQEVEKVFPELVNTDTDGTKAVEYMNMVAPLVESVKSLYQDNLTLKASYAKLQDQITDLQNQLSALKK